MFELFDQNPKYKAYVPTRTEKLLDAAVGLFSPDRQLRRMINRERMHRFRYINAVSDDVRRNASPQSSSGETQRGNRERLQLQWNAIESVENSGLAGSIRQKIVNYTVGTIKYQARTGDRTVNREYEDYIKMRTGKGLDYAGNLTLRQTLGVGVGGKIVKGDYGLNLCRENGRLYTQGIEADRLGNPYEYTNREDFIGGVEIDVSRGGRHLAYHLYRRARTTGQYIFDKRVQARTNTLGLPNFLLSKNPMNFDEVRGRSSFKTAINNFDYIEKIRQFELQALVWAAAQSGVFYTEDGNFPDSEPFEQAEVEQQADGNRVTRFQARPGTITALGLGERVEMFKNGDRTSPNVIAMYNHTVRDIAIGTGFTFGFVYDMSGLTGPAVRGASAQDKRTLDAWKMNEKEDTISPLIIILLMEGIDNGDIPYHDNFYKHDIIFPPHPTIDAGRESAANINENAAGLTSGAEIAAEKGEDIEEIHDQIADEFDYLFNKAKELAGRHGLDVWQVYGQMKSGKAVMMAPVFEAARAEQLKTQADNAEDQALLDKQKREEDAASSDGQALP